MDSPQYTITINTSENYKMCFRYVGKLTLWTRFIIRLAGWKASPVKQHTPAHSTL